MYRINEEGTPLRDDGTPMVSFKVMMRTGENDMKEKAIFIDGELLDWSIDMSSYLEAVKMGPQYMKAVQKDIAKHFIESVGETIGQKITMDDIKRGIQTGWI